ncbi:MAG: 50S ribosomal protein L3 [Syntrophobacterales bacterium]|nr:50S ribosomal protein L3 [Syntrophobacterales bacterium]
MTKGLIGRKLGMTEVFSDEGVFVPVTVIEVEPSVIVQKKTLEKDGYEALQLGYCRVSQRKLTKPLQGHQKKADKGFFRILREFQGSADGCELGQEIGLELFSPGDFVDVVGTTKGKGFAGVIKRHGFGGGRASHGSMFHRAPGSIGASADPARVFKGTKLPGHMGTDRKTVQNLRVWAVRPELNALLVKGAVPGKKQGFVLIKQAIKKVKADK